MNELAPRFSGTGLMSRDDLAKSLNNASMTMPRVGGDKQFLKLDKGNGQWTYGQEETLVEDDALWAVNPASFEHGYIAWDNNQLVEGEVMVPISDRASSSRVAAVVSQAVARAALWLRPISTEATSSSSPVAVPTMV